MEERRRYPRYPLVHKVIYRSGDSGGSELSGETKTVDVSRGGVKVKLPNTVPVNSEIHLEIFNSAYMRPIAADAKVVWLSKAGEDSYAAGLAFTRVGWLETDRLFLPEMTSA